MIFKCNECDSIFSVPDKIRHRHTEIDEGHWYETFEVCPICRGDDFEEIHQCEICGEPIPSTELLCKDCEHTLTSEKGIIDFGAQEMVPVNINSLITYLYDSDDINRILLNHLKKESDYKEKIADFVADTHDEYVEYLMEQEGII